MWHRRFGARNWPNKPHFDTHFSNDRSIISSLPSSKARPEPSTDPSHHPEMQIWELLILALNCGGLIVALLSLNAKPVDIT